MDKIIKTATRLLTNLFYAPEPDGYIARDGARPIIHLAAPREESTSPDAAVSFVNRENERRALRNRPINPEMFGVVRYPNGSDSWEL